MALHKSQSERLFSKPKEPELELILEGTLTAIPEIGPTYRGIWNGIIGPGGSCREELAGCYTTLDIAIKDGHEEVKYYGIVLPDSIGNSVVVYNKAGRKQVHDTDLGRWYT